MKLINQLKYQSRKARKQARKSQEEVRKHYHKSRFIEDCTAIIECNGLAGDSQSDRWPHNTIWSMKHAYLEFIRMEKAKAFYAWKRSLQK